MAAALNVTHGFFPPHPDPTAISVAYALISDKSDIYYIN
nr:hypothetical protein [Bacillus atrophaeus]